MKKKQKPLTIQSLQKIYWKNLKNSILVVKVGSEERPATQEDIQKMCVYLDAISRPHEKYKCDILVTHHALDFAIIPKIGKVLNFLTPEEDESG